MADTPRLEAFRVDPYLFPARGRKQEVYWVPIEVTAQLIPTFSPQGDGNAFAASRASSGVQMLIPTFSPQGDGNGVRKENTARVGISLIPTFSPQGDGNSHAWAAWIFLRRVDPYLFPARGRKPRPPSPLFTFLTGLLIPTFSPQGDGNSELTTGRFAHSDFALIPTFSPQGDGNRDSN